MSLKIVMMGTGEFALPALEGLCRSGHDVVGLFTQPDRTGRGHHHHVNVMKVTALENNVPVFQPENINTPESSILCVNSVQTSLSLLLTDSYSKKNFSPFPNMVPSTCMPHSCPNIAELHPSSMHCSTAKKKPGSPFFKLNRNLMQARSWAWKS